MKVLMFALVSMVLCAGRAFATPLSPREFYLQAIETMAHLPEPAFVTYEFDAKDEGLTGTLQTDCLPCVHVGKGRNRWPVQYRSSDHATEVTDKDGTRYFPKTFGFDPTWAGVYRALHTGMINVVGTYRDVGDRAVQHLHEGAQRQGEGHQPERRTAEGPGLTAFISGRPGRGSRR